jgi:hypothetical protein
LKPWQRWTLRGLTLIVVLVVAGVGWLFWQSLQMPAPTVSLLPTPTPFPTAVVSPTATLTPPPSPTPAFDTAVAGEIAREVAEAREVLPRWETPLTFVDTYDLSVILYRRYQATARFPVFARRTLEVLDLWPDFTVAIDPVAQAEAAAALYVPTERQLYVRRDWTGPREIQRQQIAYGYARALPEQYGNLAALRQETTELDRRLALDALAAGDAFITFCRYAGVAPDSEDARALLSMVTSASRPRWKQNVSTLDKLSRLTMMLGADFATSRYQEGGLAALDEALQRPPRATDQLLFPEAYVQADTFLVFDPLDVPLDETWTLTHTETVGAALTDFTVRTWADGAITSTVAGWDGDLLQVWQGPEDSEVVVWQTAWDSRDAAVTFVEQIEPTLPERVRGLRTPRSLPDGLPDGVWWEGRWGAAFLYRYLDWVWLVWGDDVDAVTLISDELGPSLWRNE